MEGIRELPLDKIKEQLAPPPQKLIFDETHFSSPSFLTLFPNTILFINDPNNELKDSLLSERLLKTLKERCVDSSVVFQLNEEEPPLKNVLQLELKKNKELKLIADNSLPFFSQLNAQAYKLTVLSPSHVALEYSTGQGLVHGLVTFRQLIQLLTSSSSLSNPLLRSFSFSDSPTSSREDSTSSSPKVDSSSPLSAKLKRASLRLKKKKGKGKLIKEKEEGGLIELNGLPVGMTIEDYPEFVERGFMLDVSRNRIPTMESLFHLIDLLVELKMNQLQLYTEHTFAYEGHEKVWQDYSPITPQQVLQLNSYCQQFFIDFVPNQNSFGHMNRWLIHSKYKHLAECPEGINHPFSFQKEPFSLCPNQPETFEFLSGLYDQLLPNFTSHYFNVGLDETFDLGLGKSEERCESLGKEVVYLEYLNQIYEQVKKRGKRMLFYADIILRKPELIQKLPKDVTALIWGYEFDFDFGQHAKLFRQNQVEFYVCPGTSSWSSIAGRSRNSLQNLRNASVSGREFGAKGYLITDWGDNGHLQQFSISLLPLFYGGCLSWNSLDSMQETNVLSSMNRFVFRDESNTMSRIVYELGNLHENAIDRHIPHGSLLFWPLIFPSAIHKMPAVKAFAREKAGKIGEWIVCNLGSSLIKTASFFIGVNFQGLNFILQELDRIQQDLKKTKLMGETASLLFDQINFTIDFLRFATQMTVYRSKIGLDKDVDQLKDSIKQELLHILHQLIPQFKQLWLQDCRPGGLSLSVQYFQNLINHIQGISK